MREQSVTELDNPLKMLITTFDEAFAAWLLGRRPRRVRPLNVELPASTTRSDLVFEVLQADGTTVVLHIELQGRGSHEPMPWRMLGYMSRLARRELGDRPLTGSDQLYSVVIYTDERTGVNDSGRHEVYGPTGIPSLLWRYEPILLWQMDGEELLALEEPAILPLVGRTRLRAPERTVPEVVTRIRQVEDEAQRGRLLTALVSLIRSEEVLAMVEQMLDASEELLLDTPYLRRVWQQGKEEGVLESLRETILETIARRLNPPAQEYRQASQQLANIDTRAALHRLFIVALEAEDMATFVSHLEEELARSDEQ